MSTTPLVKGYYKVKYRNGWEIAYWDGQDYFTLCGYEDWLRPEDLDEIGDYVPCP